MSNGSQIKSILGISALVSFYGIASLLVIFLGPSIGLNYTWEIIIIALLLLTWPFAILINHLRKRRALKRETAQAAPAEGTAAPTSTRAGTAPRRIHEELARAAEEAVQWLRSSKLGGARSGDALYALPGISSPDRWRAARPRWRCPLAWTFKRFPASVARR
jgi:type VI protein secretion system component VasK